MNDPARVGQQGVDGIPAAPDADVECAAMGDHDDARIHSPEALHAVAMRGVPEARAWALRGLHGTPGALSREPALAALEATTPELRDAALTALEGVALDDELVLALQTVARAHRDTTHRAVALLVAGEHEATLDDVIAHTARGDLFDERVLSALATVRADRLREAMRETTRLDGFEGDRGWVNVFRRLATVDDLPWLLDAQAEDTRVERRVAVAHLAWVVPFMMVELSTRELTALLGSLRTLDDDARGVDETTLRSRRAARTFLNIDAWRKALSAARSHQWSHVIEAASLVWGRLTPCPAAPCPEAFSAAFATLSRMTAPTRADALLAVALALGAVARALLGPLDLARDALANISLWALVFGQDALPTVGTALVDRWNALPDGDPDRAALSTILRHAIPTHPSHASTSAQWLYTRLPDVRLDVDTLLALEATAETASDLLSQTLRHDLDLLRACAARVRGETQRLPRYALVFGMMNARARWCVDHYLHELSRPERAASSLVALRSLGDPRALDAIAAHCRPDDARAATTAGFLVHIAELTSQPEHVTARSIAEPLVVAARCDRCGALATHAVQAAMVHPTPERFVAEGWDGIVFDRVVRCACGAEDEYTLSPAQRFILLAASLDATHFSSASAVFRGVCKTVGEAFARRRSAHLRALREHLAEHPDDSVAWERLGDSLRDAGLRDEAVDAWRHAMRASPNNLTVIVGYYELLRDENNVDEAGALIPAALAAWPGAVGSLDDANDSARWLANALDEHQRRLTAPVTIVLDFTARDGLVAPPFARVAITLRSSDDTFAPAVLLDPRLTALGLRETPPADAQPLGHAEAAGLFHAKPARAAVKPSTAPEHARLGRNDPCHCGSGQKFKKCHGR